MGHFSKKPIYRSSSELPSTGPFPSDRMSPQYFPKPQTDVEYSPHLPPKGGAGGKTSSSRFIGPFTSGLWTTLPQPGNPGWPRPDLTSWNAGNTEQQDTRAQRNPWQRARRHRSQNSRYNHQRSPKAHLKCIHQNPHQQDSYRSTTSKLSVSGGVWWCSPGPKIAWPLATERTRSSLRTCEAATLRLWKPKPISSTPPQTLCVPFAKRSRRQLNTGYRGA